MTNRPVQVIQRSSSVAKTLYIISILIFLAGLPLLFFQDMILIALGCFISGILVYQFARFIDWWQRGLIAANEWH